MKPIRLTVSHFNSFTDEQTVDFERLSQSRLFGISGDTGSGKTSLLDALIFALYGSGNRGNIGSLLHTGSKKATVRLEVELGGQVYTVVREIRANGTATAKLFEADGRAIEDKTERVNSFLREKIGLEKEEFTQVVVLQQGAFDRFLSASDKSRNETVSKLFGLRKYDEAIARLRADKNRLASQRKNVIEWLEAEFSEITEQSVAEEERTIEREEKAMEEARAQKQKAEEGQSLLKTAATAYEAYEKQREALQKAKQVLSDVEKEQQALDSEKQAIVQGAQERKKQEALQEAEQKKRNLYAENKGKAEELEKKEKALQERRADFKMAQDALQKANAAYAKAKEEVNAVLQAYEWTEPAYEVAESERSKAESDYTAIKERFAVEESKRKQLREAKDADKDNQTKLSGAVLILESAQKHANKIADEAQKAIKEWEFAMAQKEEQQRLQAVSTVRKQLKTGDTCPICGGICQTFVHLPNADWEIAEQAAAEAERRKEKALASRTESEVALASARVAWENGKKKKEESAALCLRLETELLSAVKEEDVKRAERQKTGREKLVSAMLCRTHAEVLAKREQAAYDEQLQTGKKQKEEILVLQAALKEGCGCVGVSEVDACIKACDEAIRNSKRICEEIIKKENLYAEKEKSLAVKTATAKASCEQIERSLTPCEPITPERMEEAQTALSFWAQRVESGVALIAEKKEKLKNSKEKWEKKKKHKAEAEAVEKQLAVLERIDKLCHGGSFSAYVAETVIREFTAAASVRLSILTQGQYALSYEKNEGKEGYDFRVRDFLSGGEKRSVATLSGGERFQTSLSLAIAISERTAHDKDYGFFFIDEGFGTLSENALGSVFESLEALSRDTVVGVITHRAELIERMPAVLKVVKADGERGSLCEEIG